MLFARISGHYFFEPLADSPSSQCLCVSFGGFFANFTVFLMRSVQVPQLSPRGCGPVLDKVVDVPIVVQCVDMMG